MWDIIIPFNYLEDNTSTVLLKMVAEEWNISLLGRQFVQIIQEIYSTLMSVTCILKKMHTSLLVHL